MVTLDGVRAPSYYMCVLGKQNFCGTVANTICGLFPWGANFHYFVVHPAVTKFSTHCVALSTRAQIWTDDVLLWLFFKTSVPLTNVLDTKSPISQAVLHVMLDSAVIHS